MMLTVQYGGGEYASSDTGTYVDYDEDEGSGYEDEKGEGDVLDEDEEVSLLSVKDSQFCLSLRLPQSRVQFQFTTTTMLASFVGVGGRGSQALAVAWCSRQHMPALPESPVPGLVGCALEHACEAAAAITGLRADLDCGAGPLAPHLMISCSAALPPLGARLPRAAHLISVPHDGPPTLRPLLAPGHSNCKENDPSLLSAPD